MTSTRGTERREVAHRVQELIIEANGGHWPANIWQWKRACRRFGVRIRILPRGLAVDAHFRAGVIYIPRRHRPPILRVLAHEAAEAVVRWEGEPPYIIPGANDWDRHLIACEVESGTCGLSSQFQPQTQYPTLKTPNN